jgi:DNA-binding transcriptional LysR family regulator
MWLKMSARPSSSTLAGVEAFCRTYELGSFTKAARRLGVTPQATSKAVARLEATLGVTLFRRSTRALAPTEAGRRYYARCSQALALLDVADGEAASHRVAPRGRVRISVPTTYGHHVFLPSLANFAARFPEVLVEVEVENHNVDLVRDGFDLAIRMGAIRDASLIARRLGDFALGVYAAPSYLARRGVPRGPEELDRHTCLTFVMPSTGRPLPWLFRDRPAQAPTPRYPIHGDPLGAVTLARSGLGLAQTYDFVVAEHAARGELVEVLASHRGHARPFSLLYPRQGRLDAPARALVDHILASRPARSPR